MEDSYKRFTRVVENYRRYRPRYPQQLIDLLKAECGLSPDQTVADIGSGTGFLTELFLKNGNRVYGVEPNVEMRSVAEALLSSSPLFTSIVGTSEATTLADHSVHMITAGQSFHWFNPEPTHQEFLRILVPRAWVVLVWNLPRNNGERFSAALDALWQTYIDSGDSFGRRRQVPDYVTRFFEGGNIQEKIWTTIKFAILKR